MIFMETWLIESCIYCKNAHPNLTAGVCFSSVGFISHTCQQLPTAVVHMGARCVSSTQPSPKPGRPDCAMEKLKDSK